MAIKKWVVYGFSLPVLTGILTVVSLAAQNADKTTWGDIWLPVLLVAAFGFIVWGIFAAIPFFRRAAALSATYIVLVTMLWTLLPFTPALPLMIGAPLIILVSVIPTTHKLIPTLTITVAMACVMCLGIFTFTGKPVEATRQQSDIVMNEKPDIYFIIPDRMPSPASMLESGINPDPIIEAFRGMGFYVRYNGLSEDTFTPYTKPSHTTRTLRYLASVLNMGEDIDYWIPYLNAGAMVKNPEVATILQANGYEYHHIGNWFPETAYSLVADYNYIYPSYSIQSRINGSLFASSVIDRSGFRAANFVPFLTDDARAITERGRQIYQVETFESIVNTPSDTPRFVFLHLLLPHPDYYWMADGSFSDTSLSLEERYLQQVQYTANQLVEMVATIIEKDAIVIIQSDEGMAYTDMELNKKLSNTQWNGTFTAWRLPGFNDDFMSIENTDILKYIIEGLEN